MGIDSHGNNGHSHSHTGCFPFLPIPIPNLVTNSHYHWDSHSHWESHSHGHLYCMVFSKEHDVADDVLLLLLLLRTAERRSLIDRRHQSDYSYQRAGVVDPSMSTRSVSDCAVRQHRTTSTFCFPHAVTLTLLIYVVSQRHTLV